VKRPRRSTRLGTLLDELAPMADKIVAQLAHHDVAVWLDQRAYITCSNALVAPQIATEYYVGTYGAGALAEDVLADLMILREEQMRHAITFD
jgi:hypothetical protein